ncbi:class V chitinase-like [Silene latifolia]|uniref:class V chitinase-like n=1 Tax=Silene latifolia TaxID=37657 RepID=UPI003D7769B1
MGFKLYYVISLIAALLSLQTSLSRAAVNGGYWLPDSGLEASEIDSTLFTHLFCAFAGLNTANNQLSISSECSSFTQTVQKRCPSVKTLLSIGGGNVLSSDFNKMASQPASRKTFITSSINVARSNGFLGLDLDWEGESTSTEMTNLGTLLTEWRTAINAEAINTGRKPLLLTAALAVTPRLYLSNATFPTQAIAKTLDWVNVMAYDFYAPNNSPLFTHSHAALHDPTGAASGSSGISAWISAGVPPKQLVLGFPFYGYAWKLVNPNNHGILAPANGTDTSVGAPPGTLIYSQIKEFIPQKKATVVFNSTYGTNYCYSGTTWINYDDTQTIAAKVSYVKTNNLLGYFAWHLAQDNNWALSKQASQTWRS